MNAFFYIIMIGTYIVQGGGVGSRPVLKLGVAQQAGDEFVAKQTFISLFRNGMNAFFISL